MRAGKNLIIIGNGFDLAHNLKTSYKDFKEHILERPDEYGSLKRTDNFLLRFFMNNDYELWSDVEVVYFNILNNKSQ